MKHLRDLLDRVVGGLCAALLLALVGVLTWQVLSRYALNAPSTYSEEILRYGVIWLSLLGAAYATGQGTHMCVDLLREFSSGWRKRALEFLVPLGLMAFASVTLIYGGYKATAIAARQVSSVMQIPMSWVYLALPVGGTLMILYCLLNLYDLITGTRDLPDAAERAVAAGD
ncbi:TRAP transporter small permease [Donghicola tyrosinivorans]|uniref:TRAP transporter small permease protein n=1 Tax=Donghicola tyrosinivorans TaxID=1652492 RepID=A0A2T0WDA6_9RHOB|nr:TRAP transporter small permease [Donghicola tyrosinivorans]PRY84682.1 TRAP-type C4-dicarboxylate transport system permease small subunit [Donghicola tyrosinivorans]